jgi:Leucine-rich repeat (LRR) protein
MKNQTAPSVHPDATPHQRSGSDEDSNAAVCQVADADVESTTARLRGGAMDTGSAEDSKVEEDISSDSPSLSSALEEELTGRAAASECPQPAPGGTETRNEDQGLRVKQGATRESPGSIAEGESRLQPVEEMEGSSLPAPPPPALLSHAATYTLDLQPGAFRVSPGSPPASVRQRIPQDESEEHFHFRGSENQTPASDLTRARTDEIYLVQADLVNDAPVTVAPVPPPPLLVEALPLRRKRFVILFGLASALVIAIAVGVSLGVAAANKQTAFVPSTSASPSASHSAAPSSLPSAQPSNAPSLQPSSPPTTAISFEFWRTLPNFTKRAARNETSPQARAFDWVAVSDRRRNISRMTQRFALATLFFSTAGDISWTNREGWLNSSVHECNWHGCYCPENRTVQMLDLESNNLYGYLPKESYLLKALESFVLNDNSELQGKLFSEVGRLLRLTSLDFSATSISGPLPTEIGLLTRLTNINLQDTMPTGSIPTEIGNLQQLGVLDLSIAELRGSIPTELGRLSRLSELSLSVNYLSSTIPSELGNLSSLINFIASENHLRGALPSELSSLSALQVLRLYRNVLNGSIPSGLGRLSRLSICLLFDNVLSGSIPTELGNATSLSRLVLYNNSLDGPIPTELGMLTSLEDLALSQNRLTGTIPTELGLLPKITSMDFGANLLYGYVPSELCKLVAKGVELRVDCEKVNCSCDCICA